VIATHAARHALGSNVRKVAAAAIKAVLKNGRSLEIAHQQIRFGQHDVAFCSRIGSLGDLIVELDIGDPRLSNRIIHEEDLRRASKSLKRNLPRR
jgi:hypothetical protein